MSKPVHKPLPEADRPKPPDGVSERIFTVGGESVVGYTVVADKETFGRQLGWVFARNVKRARKENERLTGNPDGIVDRD